METQHEREALTSISEKFLFGDLLKMMVNEIRSLSVPFSVLTEAQQQQIIERVRLRTEQSVREVVRIITGKARPVVEAQIESVLFKDGVKVQLTFSRQQGDRHALADAAGDSVLLVLPQYGEVLGGDVPRADKDQPELPV
jgi:hypothetical protein